jgi:hypothetical protein
MSRHIRRVLPVRAETVSFLADLLAAERFR